MKLWIRDQYLPFVLALQDEGKSARTVASYGSDVIQFLEWCDEQGLTADMPAALRTAAPRWLNHNRSTASAATTQRRRSSLKSFFRLVHDTDPLLRYKVPPAAPGQAHPLPGLMDDVRRLLAVTSGQARVAVALCGFAGLRISEVRDLTWANIYWWPTQSITVVGKGEKTRYVPMAPELVNILRVHMTSLPEAPGPDDLIVTLSDKGIRRIITRAGRDAEIARPISSHDLRMTFGTVIYNKTKDLRLTQELLGHADPKTTERYTGISEAAKRNAVNGAVA